MGYIIHRCHHRLALVQLAQCSERLGVPLVLSNAERRMAVGSEVCPPPISQHRWQRSKERSCDLKWKIKVFGWRAFRSSFSSERSIMQSVISRKYDSETGGKKNTAMGL